MSIRSRFGTLLGVILGALAVYTGYWFYAIGRAEQAFYALVKAEQDRGNALIGVPVKVTAGYHMIALNDDEKAVASNLDLMKERGV